MFVLLPESGSRSNGTGPGILHLTTCYNKLKIVADFVKNKTIFSILSLIYV